MPEQPDLKVRLEPRDLPERMALLALPVLRVHKAKSGLPVLLALPEKPERLVLLVLRGRLFTVEIAPRRMARWRWTRGFSVFFCFCGEYE